MKKYIVKGGHTTYVSYETLVKANNKIDASRKAEKLPIEKWENFEEENGGDFAIDSVLEDDDE